MDMGDFGLLERRIGLSVIDKNLIFIIFRDLFEFWIQKKSEEMELMSQGHYITDHFGPYRQLITKDSTKGHTFLCQAGHKPTMQSDG